MRLPYDSRSKIVQYLKPIEFPKTRDSAVHMTIVECWRFLESFREFSEDDVAFKAFQAIEQLMKSGAFGLFENRQDLVNHCTHACVVQKKRIIIIKINVSLRKPQTIPFRLKRIKKANIDFVVRRRRRRIWTNSLLVVASEAALFFYQILFVMCAYTHTKIYTFI